MPSVFSFLFLPDRVKGRTSTTWLSTANPLFGKDQIRKAQSSRKTEMVVPGGPRYPASSRLPAVTKCPPVTAPTSTISMTNEGAFTCTTGRGPVGESGACEQLHTAGTGSDSDSPEQHDCGRGSGCSEQHAWSVPRAAIRQSGAPPNPTEVGRMKAATKNPMKK